MRDRNPGRKKLLVDGINAYMYIHIIYIYIRGVIGLSGLLGLPS